ATASATSTRSTKRNAAIPTFTAAPGPVPSRRRRRALPGRSTPAARARAAGPDRDAARGAGSRSRPGTKATSANRATRDRTPGNASFVATTSPEWSRADRTARAPRPAALGSTARRCETRPSVAELPHGTITFLFTDIEGSTRLLKQLGERYGIA